jgi:hypothetical protein
MYLFIHLTSIITTQLGFIIMQVYTFCLFLTFSFVQNTPGLFAAFGFKYSEDLIASPMPGNKLDNVNCL